MKKLALLIFLFLTSCTQNPARDIDKTKVSDNAPPKVTPYKTGVDISKDIINGPEVMPTPEVLPTEVEIARFETKYSVTPDGRDENIQLACKTIDGTVIEAGGTFSFNDVVGERTKERGYKKAKMFLNGERVTGYGGGVCQVSSTIYNAALLANFEIIERHAHPKPIDYLPPGKDATVNFGTMDLKFKNNRPYPVRIECKSDNLTVLVVIYEIVS